MPTLNNIKVAGGGLAGCAAALTILDAGAAVTLFEPSLFAKHKVCGEFLSPEGLGALEELGVWSELALLRPPLLQRMKLVFDRRVCEDRLPQPAAGISRFQLDAMLRKVVRARGGRFVQERATAEPGEVWTVGRQNPTSGTDRIFGFKSHFSGPTDDAVELFFSESFYVGIVPVEGGCTNICGLAQESLLRQTGFDYDQLLRTIPSLSERTAPLSRQLSWLTTGPIVYGRRPAPARVYPAGDSLSFVDPFTGSGMLAALQTGRLAGRMAVQQQPVTKYLSEVNRRLRRPLAVSAVFRAALRSGLGELLAPLIPGRWLFSLTRPM